MDRVLARTYRASSEAPTILASTASVLLVDDSKDFRRSLARALKPEYRVRTACSRHEALKRLTPTPDAILLDLRLVEHDETNADALTLLSHFCRELPHVPVVMITSYADVETAVECIRLGAADFIQKGGDLRELKARVAKALTTSRALLRLRSLEEELDIVEPRRLVGTSASLQAIKDMIAAVARDAQISVLITGETGTGKELVARSIHASGERSSRPFVGVALAALPESTVEAELFGHESGAFTDAKRRHLGLIERADGGVLFLDEIGELTPTIQIKLLRFLEERSITRLGGKHEIPVRVQVVAATNADLNTLAGDGRFREDLYYRLKVCEIRLPPLRDRAEDIPPIVEHFLLKLGRDKGIKSINDSALETLRAYPWPGNVRELRNALEASVLRAGLRGGHVVAREDIPEDVRTGRPAVRPPSVQPGNSQDLPTLEIALARTELQLVEGALRMAHGKKTQAWKILGLNDRFVFTRRVRRLCERFPELVKDYPGVWAAFAQD